MKINLKTVIIILGMVASAVFAVWATFTPRPVHNKDFKGTKEKVETAKGSILRELDKMQQRRAIKDAEVQRKLEKIEEHWHTYNSGTTTPEP